ncbi:hypothetical protein HC891_09455 [Candidatus Gracilibacteria bacterium]|nr:hypothetical protein [Candidatus Gracilibacteria bacterium]
MTPDYSDNDTARVRQAELSSAGQQTVNLGAQLPTVASGSANMVGSPATQRNNPWGWLLIGLGALLLLSNVVWQTLNLEAGVILLTIASCFLFFSLWKRIFPLFIPGAILAGLAFGITFEPIASAASILWGIALGFLAILFVGRGLFKEKSDWAVFPAVPLFAVGFMVFVLNGLSVFGAGVIWVPIMLIGLGLYLGWGRR